MKYFDQHIHTTYSPDGRSELSSYLEKVETLGISNFVVTDHCDFHEGLQDADFDKQLEEIKVLRKKYPHLNIMQGIELGYEKVNVDRIKNFISTHNFSLINLSIHLYKDIDYYFIQDFQKYGIDNVMRYYLENAIEAVTNIDDFDVFCHFDYAYKTTVQYGEKVDIKDYEELIIKLFKTIIAKDKVLEINTKVQSVVNSDEHLDYILGLYKSLGGKNLIINSDAHHIDRYLDKFEEMKIALKRNGFDKICYFVDRKRYYYDI